MKKAFLTFLGAVFLFVGASAANAQKQDDAKTKAVLKVFNDWDKAYVKRDAAPLMQILTDDYMGIDEDGRTTTKSDEIELIKKGEYIILSMEYVEPPKVRFYGRTAIVTSHAKVKQTYKGETSTLVARATTVLVNQERGSWKVASWHASKLKDD